MKNTIHKARLRSLGYQEVGRPRIALVKLGDYGPAARVSAEKLGGCERWGMMLCYEFPFEPYSYALALLDESFRLINDMLEQIHRVSTDVEIDDLCHRYLGGSRPVARA